MSHLQHRCNVDAARLLRLRIQDVADRLPALGHNSSRVGLLSRARSKGCTRQAGRLQQRHSCHAQQTAAVLPELKEKVRRQYRVAVLQAGHCRRQRQVHLARMRRAAAHRERQLLCLAGLVQRLDHAADASANSRPGVHAFFEFQAAQLHPEQHRELLLLLQLLLRLLVAQMVCSQLQGHAWCRRWRRRRRRWGCCPGLGPLDEEKRLQQRVLCIRFRV